MLGNKDSQDSSLNDLNCMNQNDNPQDTVSAISWVPDNNMKIFSAASWDSKIRIYELQAQGMQKGLALKATFNADDPCICTSWSDDCKTLFTGSINASIYGFDIGSGKSVTIGAHNAGVKDCYWLPNPVNMLCTLSFDKTMKFWDLKSNQPAGTIELGYKAYCSDLSGGLLVVGLSDEKLVIYNFANMQSLQNKPEYIDSPLGIGSQLTCVSFFSDQSGLGTASHDGRANLSSFQQDNYGKAKLNNIMTFKAHKIEHSSTNAMLYPVHGIGFHPKSKYFVYTAGGEGQMYFWDYQQKNKICGFAYKNTPITKVKMSPDGLCLAYGLGYDWARGIEGHMSFKTKICCHIMQENELVYNK